MSATATAKQYPSAELKDLVGSEQFGHVVAGETEPGNGQPYDVVNPSSGEPIVTIKLGTAEDVDRAVGVARKALPHWRRKTPGQRAEVLNAVADVIDGNVELFAQLESLNVGKPLSLSRGEMAAAGDVIRFMAGAARAAHAPAPGEYTPGHFSYIQREPLGVVGAVTPWNYPLMTAVFKIGPALAAGNTMVLKPSEITPLSTILFAQLIADVLPRGVLNVVLGDGPTVGQALAEHRDVDVISLTGSKASGVKVAAAGSATLKHVHLELGGKAPVIVFDDADLSDVVGAVRSSAFINSGQECGAGTRVLCTPQIQEELVEELKSAIGSIRTGAPEDGDDIEMGPLVSEQHLRRVEAHIEKAKRDGVTVELGGAQDADRSGFFYEPTVLSNVLSAHDVSQTEVFGPLVTVQSFDSEADAVRIANEVDYGLAASVWTENGRRALRVVDALDYGTVWVNAHLVTATEMPWVGFGPSGLGRELSTYALDDFSRTKHVMMTKRAAGEPAEGGTAFSA
jgi:aminobutyraldehyde dehydrogenase